MIQNNSSDVAYRNIHITFPIGSARHNNSATARISTTSKANDTIRIDWREKLIFVEKGYELQHFIAALLAVEKELEDAKQTETLS